MKQFQEIANILGGKIIPNTSQKERFVEEIQYIIHK